MLALDHRAEFVPKKKSCLEVKLVSTDAGLLHRTALLVKDWASSLGGNVKGPIPMPNRTVPFLVQANDGHLVDDVDIRHEYKVLIYDLSNNILAEYASGKSMKLSQLMLPDSVKIKFSYKSH